MDLSTGMIQEASPERSTDVRKAALLGCPLCRETTPHAPVSKPWHVQESGFTSTLEILTWRCLQCRRTHF